MDIKKYEALLYAIDLGSFSAAADVLGYTPAGISHMVDAVEASVGFPLLRRGYSGVSMNECGTEIIAEMRQIVKHESILKQRVSDLTGLVTGKVTVGAYFSIASHWLPDIFRNFLRDYPGVDIQVREGGHHLLTRWMENSELDFCMYSYDAGSGYKWFPLCEDRMVVVVPEGHPLAARQSVPFQVCSDYPFIMPAQGQDYDVMRLLQKHSIKLNIRFSTIENYSALAMVESGLGISIMNELITKGLVRRIVCLPFDIPQSISLGIAVPSMYTASPAAKKLIHYIRESFRPSIP